jgi:uncharacterized protein YcfJ
MNRKLFYSLGVVAFAAASTQALANITFYEGEGFRGRAFTADKPVGNFERFGFNDRASSAVVDRGRWEVCEDARFGGRCVVLRRGSYDSLNSMGIGNRISSARPVSGNRRYENEPPPPMVTPAYEYRRRPTERIYEAQVTDVRAVMGPPDRRCWVERREVADAGPRGDANVGGAIVGGIIGGILGHQVGGGRGKDVATAGGAIAGAAIGSQAGSGNYGSTYTQDVRRCDRVSGPPAYWDVTYNFRGTSHHVQMAAPPAGNTITVNERGEPRG